MREEGAPLRILVAIVLAAASLLLALVGCCRQEEPVTGGGPKIEFWHVQNYDPTQGVVEAAVARFRAAHPGVTVEVVAMQPDQYKQKLKVAIGAGSGPDVFHTWGGGALEALVDAGRALDLSGYLEADGWRERLNPMALSFATFGGRVFAVPADITVVPVWYNREIFAAQGILPPKTFAELRTACMKLKAAGIIPMALGNAKSWPGSFYFVYLATRYGGLAPFRAAAARDNGGSFEDDAFIAAGRGIRDLVDLGAFPLGFNGIGYDQSRRLFFNGDAAMTVMGTWILAHCRDEAPGFLPKMGCFPFPAVAGGRGSSTTIVGGINAAYAVSADCEEPELAAELLRHLTSVETARAWAATGRIPAIAGEGAREILAEGTAEAAEILFDADTIQLYYDQYLPPRLAEQHKETTQAIFAGTQTPEAAAASMEALAREIAGEGGR